MNRKRLLSLMGALLLTASGMMAQNDKPQSGERYYPTSRATEKYFAEVGSAGDTVTPRFRLGSDLDKTKYLIGSPYDNWYLEVGAGVQTYIGNELQRSARWNKVNYDIYAEVGKWLIPDLAVSFYFSHFDMSSQSQYPRNPYIDFTSQPNDNGYYNTHAFAFSFGGLVTLDWTNLCLGYDRGKRKLLHISTPVGLGYMLNFSKKYNENPYVPKPINQELYATAALHLDYYVSPVTSLTAALRGTVTRESFDYSPYNDLYTCVDIMPAVTIGARFNLIKNVQERDTAYAFFRDGDSLERKEIIRGFIPGVEGSRIDALLDRLKNMRQQLLDSEARGNMLEAERDALLDSIDSLKRLIADIDTTPLGPGDDPIADLYELALRNPRTSAIVYFQLDRYNLDYNARRTLQNFANRISNHEDFPASNVYYLVGSADDSTGSAPHNWDLSIHRSGSVHSQLTKVHHIPSNQLEKVFLGGIHRYSPKQMNRVCIVILKDEKSTAIVEKWKTDIRRK